MLINTIPDDCLMYTDFNLIFNIMSIVNMFMLSIEKKTYTHTHTHTHIYLYILYIYIPIYLAFSSAIFLYMAYQENKTLDPWAGLKALCL